jgi:peptidoglycan/xylan/chitin deacetylase (PgdA/CDA1 family)
MTDPGDGIQPEAPRISLTFDDGPDPVWTPRVLEALQWAEAQATFFVVASQVQRFPHLISDVLRAGHGVEFHCTQHVRHTDRTRGEVEADLLAGLRTLEMLGVYPRFWRPPWGVLAPFTAEIADEFGLEIVLWTEGTRDWRGDLAPEMLERLRPRLRSGSVVLMHDGIGPGASRSGCGETVALVGGLVECIRSLGCEPGLLTTTPGANLTVGAPSAKEASSEQERLVRESEPKARTEAGGTAFLEGGGHP